MGPNEGFWHLCEVYFKPQVLVFATHPTVKVHQVSCRLAVSLPVLQKMRLCPVVCYFHSTTSLEFCLQHWVYGSFALLFKQLLLHAIYLQSVGVSRRIRLWGVHIWDSRGRLRLWRWQTEVSHHRSQALPFFAELTWREGEEILADTGASNSLNTHY